MKRSILAPWYCRKCKNRNVASRKPTCLTCLFAVPPSSKPSSSFSSTRAPVRSAILPSKLEPISNETKIRDRGQDQDCTSFDGVSRVKAFNKGITLKEGTYSGLRTVNTNSGAVSRSLKILSYNVRFREDPEMNQRMDAIGDLIQQHSPDLICFQEVTAQIHYKLCQSSWGKVYQRAFSRETIDRKQFYCVLFSKLQLSCINCIPFRNSKRGRKLCIVEVKVQEGKYVVVATSHLESPLDPPTRDKKLSKEPPERPCLSPPTWDHKLYRERVEQAREAINRLENNQNVIFCADLNWDDELDGRFPLPEGWMYVTRPNQMSGNCTLQKQLDRFICNLRDFKISRIDMMGMEAIPGHWREKKVKNELKLELPAVSPSDHYRLLLTIISQ